MVALQSLARLGHGALRVALTSTSALQRLLDSCRPCTAARILLKGATEEEHLGLEANECELCPGHWKIGKKEITKWEFCLTVYLTVVVSCFSMPAMGFRSFHLHPCTTQIATGARTLAKPHTPCACEGGVFLGLKDASVPWQTWQTSQRGWRGCCWYPYPLLVWWLFGILGNMQESF